MTTLTIEPLNLEAELLDAETAKAYFVKALDEIEIARARAWLDKYDVGDKVRVAIRKDTDAESARHLKQILNQAAKQHHKRATKEDGSKVLLFAPDGTPVTEGVKLRWDAETHKETVQRAGKNVDVLIVDKLIMYITAGAVRVTTETPATPPPTPPTPPTPTPATPPPNRVAQPARREEIKWGEQQCSPHPAHDRRVLSALRATDDLRC